MVSCKIPILATRVPFPDGACFSESRRDQEEGGELDPHEEVSPEEIRSGEVVLG